MNTQNIKYYKGFEQFLFHGLLLNKEQGVQVSDTTMHHSRAQAGYKNLFT